jgi:hypothetical protein
LTHLTSTKNREHTRETVEILLADPALFFSVAPRDIAVMLMRLLFSFGRARVPNMGALRRSYRTIHFAAVNRTRWAAMFICKDDGAVTAIALGADKTLLSTRISVEGDDGGEVVRHDWAWRPIVRAPSGRFFGVVSEGPYRGQLVVYDNGDMSVVHCANDNAPWIDVVTLCVNADETLLYVQTSRSLLIYALQGAQTGRWTFAPDVLCLSATAALSTGKLALLCKSLLTAASCLHILDAHGNHIETVQLPDHHRAITILCVDGNDNLYLSTLDVVVVWSTHTRSCVAELSLASTGIDVRHRLDGAVLQDGQVVIFDTLNNIAAFFRAV